MRTIEELRARIDIVKAKDFFGFGLGDLVIYDPDMLEPDKRHEAWSLDDANQFITRGPQK